MKKGLIIAAVTAFAVLAIGGYWFYAKQKAANEPIMVGNDRDSYGCIGSAGYSWCEAKKKCLRPFEETCTAIVPKNVTFHCKDNKSIRATFYIGEDKTVDLALSDGRKISIPRTMSASGARYANAEETFVFWNKGDTAFIDEGADRTFVDCNLVE